MHGRLLNQLSQANDELVKDFRKRYNKFNDHLTEKITEDQFKDLTSHDLKRFKKVMAEHVEMGQRLRLKTVGSGNQLSHILGSQEYKDRVSKGEHPSYFEEGSNLKDIHNHMLQEMNMSNIFQRYQFIDIRRINGTYVYIDRDTGEFISENIANQIKIYQSKTGIHGIPNKEKRVR